MNVIESNISCKQTELVERLKSGDEYAFETLVRDYSGKMLNVASRFLRCEQDAADAVQDAFVSAFQNIGNFEGNSQLSTWLHRIVVNASLMKLRSQSRRHEEQTGSEVPEFDSRGAHARPVSEWSPEGLTRACAVELKSQVRQYIDELPESYRTVLLLRDIEECDTEETARLLGESPANVKTRLHRARKALRSKIEPFMLA